MRKVKLFALSTCGWCRMARRFLEENKIDHECVYVDMLTGDEKAAARTEISRHSPDRRAYPMFIIDEKDVIFGFQEEELRKALGL